MYKGVIAYANGNTEEVKIFAKTYIEAMRKFHRICNERINIGHMEIIQTLLVKS